MPSSSVDRGSTPPSAFTGSLAVRWRSAPADCSYPGSCRSGWGCLVPPRAFGYIAYIRPRARPHPPCLRPALAPELYPRRASVINKSRLRWPAFWDTGFHIDRGGGSGAALLGPPPRLISPSGIAGRGARPARVGRLAQLLPCAFNAWPMSDVLPAGGTVRERLQLAQVQLSSTAMAYFVAARLRTEPAILFLAAPSSTAFVTSSNTSCPAG